MNGFGPAVFRGASTVRVSLACTVGTNPYPQHKRENVLKAALAINLSLFPVVECCNTNRTNNAPAGPSTTYSSLPTNFLVLSVFHAYLLSTCDRAG